MTGSKCLLDTSIIINSFRNDPNTVSKLLTFSEIYIPSIVIGELYYGAYHSANTPKHLAQVVKLYTILVVDTAIANLYGSIKATLKQKGKSIPENDMWIATIAIHHDFQLFTADKHFNEIDTLALV